MDDSELLERTEAFLAQVEAIRQSLDEFRSELLWYKKALRRKLRDGSDKPVPLDGHERPPPPDENRAAIPLASQEAPIPLANVSKPAPAPQGNPPAQEKREAPMSKAAKARERRDALRRQGPPVPLLISYSRNGSSPFPGWVTDCSSGGLGVMVAQMVPVGSLLSVRPSNAPTRFAWIQMEVRNSRVTKGKCNIGCRFLQDVPLEDLDLFRPLG